ncbi:TY-Chap domain-containing protein [Paenarthrobacter nicotinovorans]|uniref:TY-Chap domain-containing protein n=1 Tax=Paenarthrobacter nicotinovorans TaxID=29320 RepID=UPI00326118E0
MASAKRRQSRIPNSPASNHSLEKDQPTSLIKPGQYAVLDGVEYQILRRGDAWVLLTDTPTPGFSAWGKHGYIREIGPGEQLECHDVKHRGTYRGLIIEVLRSGPHGFLVSSLDPSAGDEGFEGFDPRDRDQEKNIPHDDPDLLFSTVRTRVPMPWAERTPSERATFDWNDFRDRLAVTLRGLTDRAILIITSSMYPNRYVQFARQGDRLDAEAPGKDVVANAVESVLKDAGWQAPGVAEPNWSSGLPLPALTPEFRELAERCVAALRNSYGVKSPDDLSYRAWREAELMPAGQTWSAERVAGMDPGSASLELPGLGLDSNRLDSTGTVERERQPTLWVSSLDHPLVEEILSTPPMKAINPRVKLSLLTHPDGVLEWRFLAGTKVIAVTDDGTLELRHAGSNPTKVVARADSVRPFVLDLVRGMLWPEKQIATFEDAPGVDVKVGPNGTEIRWGRGHWVDFIGGFETFRAAYPLIHLLNATDAEIVQSMEAADGRPVFRVGESLKDAAAAAGYNFNFFSYSAWRVWLERAKNENQEKGGNT